jgi:hypothetical protein
LRNRKKSTFAKSPIFADITFSDHILIYVYIYICVRVCVCIHISMCGESESRSSAARARRMTASSAASPMLPSDFPPPPLSTAVIAPEDVEHAVGRRREAHAVAPGGARAGGRQRRPGVGRRAEAVHVVAFVEVAFGWRRGARARAHLPTGAGAAGGGRRLPAAGEAGSGAASGVSGSAILHARGRPGQCATAAGRG